MIVVDTDVWSYLFKGDTRAEVYRPLLSNTVVAVSFQTVAELHYWAEVNQWGLKRRNEMTQALGKFLILFCDEQMAVLWARIRAERTKAGLPISPQDAWVAASALRHDAELLTNNKTDYVSISGLRLA